MCSLVTSNESFLKFKILIEITNLKQFCTFSVVLMGFPLELMQCCSISGKFGSVIIVQDLIIPNQLQILSKIQCYVIGVSGFENEHSFFVDSINKKSSVITQDDEIKMWLTD